MASLKEVKTRINSVENTKKITVARQMISSARLHQLQAVLEKTVQYKQALESVVERLCDPQQPFSNELTMEREQGAVALIIIASNSGMCGAFNARMIKELHTLSARYSDEPLMLYPIGKKIREAATNLGCNVQGHFDELAGKFSLENSAKLINSIINAYRSGKYKKVIMVYYHYKNMANQLITNETLLPYAVPASSDSCADSHPDDYIIEPSAEAIIADTLPQLIRAKFYAALADNQTSEHAARTLAMQLASENANDILEELRLNYNKLRQQNITSELLDIIGGSFA